MARMMKKWKTMRFCGIRILNKPKIKLAVQEAVLTIYIHLRLPSHLLHWLLCALPFSLVPDEVLLPQCATPSGASLKLWFCQQVQGKIAWPSCLAPFLIAWATMSQFHPNHGKQHNVSHISFDNMMIWCHFIPKNLTCKCGRVQATRPPEKIMCLHNLERAQTRYEVELANFTRRFN